MVFLIEFNRTEDRIVELREFEDSERIAGETARMELELDLNRKGIDHEVVLLEAESKDALLNTHRRYFQDLRQLLMAGVAQVK